MPRIKVRNFGPIVEGYTGNDGFMEIRKVTVLIGNQGTGKSCVAKLLSTFCWLEKALLMGWLNETHIKLYNRFVKTYCAYQGLQDYFKDSTELEYVGNYYSFTFNQKKLEVNRIGNSGDYLIPKIMYIPAERNFVSVVSQPDKLKRLPLPLYTFLEEYIKALEDIPGKLELPIGDAKIEFNKSHKISYIAGSDYRIKLSEASSGFQSFTPLYIVSRNIAHSIQKTGASSENEMTVEERKKLREEIERIMKNDKLSDEVKQTALESLSARLKPGFFINIVEEIEQNLYPKSQRNLLYKLLEFANLTLGNELILTTHSPYIIDYLTISTKAHAVWKKADSANASHELKRKLGEIVPRESSVSITHTAAYELNEQGEIHELKKFEDILSDDNLLNKSLQETNELFDQLIEIEEEL